MRLTVLYDPNCRVCRMARGWLQLQKQLVPLEFVGAGSAEAARRFPSLTADQTLHEIHVIDDRGRVYRGSKAWTLCIWALEDFRSWSIWMSQPHVQPRARQFVEMFANNRHRFGGPSVRG